MVIVSRRHAESVVQRTSRRGSPPLLSEKEVVEMPVVNRAPEESVQSRESASGGSAAR